MSVMFFYEFKHVFNKLENEIHYFKNSERLWIVKDAYKRMYEKY